jgi:surface protein
MKTRIIAKVIALDKFDLGGHINEAIRLNGLNCSLNHIDVSDITDMNNLFYSSEFNGDISEWDVSKVKNMSKMFYQSKFNGDISKWDVSNVKDMGWMFTNSKFNGDISKWNVSNVKNMHFMFYASDLSHDLSDWTPIKLESIEDILGNCDAPIPYWVNFDNRKERNQAIEKYNLSKQLGAELDNKNHQLKKIKI